MFSRDNGREQPVDVDGCTAVASDDVPLVDQAFVTIKHAVRTERLLNILALLFTSFFFLLLSIEVVASDQIHHGFTVVLPLTSELHVTGNLAACNLVAQTEAQLCGHGFCSHTTGQTWWRE